MEPRNAAKAATMVLLRASRTCARVVVVDVLQCDFSGMLVEWVMGTSTISRMRLSTVIRIALGC